MLLTNLENLRDVYNQKLKTANSLMNSIRGATKSLNKVEQILGDYVDQSMAFDQSDLYQTQETLVALNFNEGVSGVLIPGLRQEVRELKKLVAALRGAIAALSVDPVDIIKLDRGYTIFQNSTIQSDDLQSILPDLETALQQAQEQLGHVFGAALRDRLIERNIAIGGRPPRFEAGRFEIVANFVSRKVTLHYGKDVVARNVSISLDSVMKAYERALKDIQGRNEDGATWIKQLYEAWQLVNLKTGKSNARVGLVDCYYEMVLLRQKRGFTSEPSKRGFRDYSRAQFAYDLDFFTRQQRLSHNGFHAVPHVATKSQAETTSKSIWVVHGDNPHNGEYMGSIEFERD